MCLKLPKLNEIQCISGMSKITSKLYIVDTQINNIKNNIDYDILSNKLQYLYMTNNQFYSLNPEELYTCMLIMYKWCKSINPRTNI